MLYDVIYNFVDPVKFSTIPYYTQLVMQQPFNTIISIIVPVPHPHAWTFIKARVAPNNAVLCWPFFRCLAAGSVFVKVLAGVYLT